MGCVSSTPRKYYEEDDYEYRRARAIQDAYARRGGTGGRNQNRTRHRPTYHDRPQYTTYSNMTGGYDSYSRSYY